MTPSSRRRIRLAAEVAVVLAGCAGLLLLLRRASPTLYGFDGWYHIRYAEILRARGIFRTFPWWQETFLRDHWADKDFLFHVLLVPFTFGELLAGAKAAGVLFSTATVAAFFLVARRLRVPWALGWTAVLLACSADLLYRLGFTRPGVLAVAVALGGMLAVFRSRPWVAFALAAAYANLHVSFPVLPGLALLHDLHRDRPQGARLGPSASPPPPPPEPWSGCWSALTSPTTCGSSGSRTSASSAWPGVAPRTSGWAGSC